MNVPTVECGQCPPKTMKKKTVPIQRPAFFGEIPLQSHSSMASRSRSLSFHTKIRPKLRPMSFLGGFPARGQTASPDLALQRGLRPGHSPSEIISFWSKSLEGPVFFIPSIRIYHQTKLLLYRGFFWVNLQTPSFWINQPMGNLTHQSFTASEYLLKALLWKDRWDQDAGDQFMVGKCWKSERPTWKMLLKWGYSLKYRGKCDKICVLRKYFEKRLRSQKTSSNGYLQ